MKDSGNKTFAVENQFLNGNSEMAQLTRSFNWAATSLGSPDKWPQSLKTTLSIILNSKFPMFLWWGPDLICFYNDAYRPSLGYNGKHPSILGMPAAAAWPEIWDVIKPLIDPVLAGGEATWSEDQLIPIYRNGQLEDVYWTFSYSPVADESGRPAGVFVTCYETTGKIKALKELEENNKQLQVTAKAELLAQRKIKESENNLRLVVLQAPVAIAIFRGPEYVVEIANLRALELWGRESAEVLNRPILAAMPELKTQGIKELLDSVYKTGEPFSATELPVKLLKEGVLETAYINFVYEPLYDWDGNINGLITIGIDVTEQFLARKRIEESEERFRTMAEGTDILIAVGDELSNATYFNKAWTDLTGRPLKKLLEFGWVDLIHPDDRDQYVNIYLNAFKQQIPFTGEFRVLSVKGGYRWLLAKGPPRFRADGSFAGYISSCIDITEAKKQQMELQSVNEEMAAANEELIVTNEELYETQENLSKKIRELADSETRFRTLVEQSPVAITVLRTRELIIDIVNSKMLEIWGKTPEISGKTLAVAMPELEGQPFFKIMDDVFTSGEAYYGNESRAFVIRNGILVEGYFNFICQPLKDERGSITSILQVVTEVTEQVNVRLELQKAEEMMRLAVEAARLGSWHINPVTKELKYNSMLARIFGYEGEEDMTYEQAIGQVSEEYQSKIINEIEKAIADGGDYDITYTQRRFNDGELIWLRSLGKVTQDINGNHAIFSGLVMDITEQKQDDQRKNDFIGMVSHELKTPLTSLNAIIQVLNSKLKDSEDRFIAGALDKAHIQVKKMSSMINGFLNISRLESGKISLNKHHFLLDELLKEIIEETLLISSSHQIIFELCSPVNLYADADKIGSVITNLLSNAIKYSPKGNIIEVKCRKYDNMVQVSVKDDGMGVKPEDIDKLFDRYYRVETRHTAHISGFGIGLYLSAEIIHRHHGEIWVESESGKGSTFYFTLPINEKN